MTRLTRIDAQDILFTLPVAGVGQLVVLDTDPSTKAHYRDSMGREVFLLDETGTVLWQIAPQQGTTRGRSHDFDPAQATTEPFVNVWWGGEAYHASRFSGDSFRIDLRSGTATYSGWART